MGRQFGGVLHALGSRQWREGILSALAAWNRHQGARIIVAVVVAWLVGATAFHLAERGVNSDFAT